MPRRLLITLQHYIITLHPSAHESVAALETGCRNLSSRTMPSSPQSRAKACGSFLKTHSNQATEYSIVGRMPPGLKSTWGQQTEKEGGGGEREACEVRSMLDWPRKEKKMGMKAHLGKLEKPGEVLLR